MKRGIFYGILAVSMIAMSAACNMTKKVDVNGEKVELADGIYTKISTNYGDILIQFDTDKAPMTSANFMMLAEGTHPNVSEDLKGKPYFDGLTFHRVIDGFMIQGGDPAGNGSGGPGYQFPNETSPELTHTKGVISMANSGPNTNGSQFFITVAETKQLDGGYSVFGKVVEGQSVADTIAKVEKNERDMPNSPATMNTVTIIRVGSDYADWDAAAAFESGKSAFEESQKAEMERMQLEAEEAAKNAAAMGSTLLAQYPNAQTSSTGLMYIIEDEGKGEKPASGAMVNVHYAGWFTDGRLLDTSIKSIAEANEMYDERREPYAPMQTPYGPQNQLIQGFVEGLSMLNVGGKAKLIIPPNLAWGAQGAGQMIPPHSWVIFDIELVSVAEATENHEGHNH